ADLAFITVAVIAADIPATTGLYAEFAVITNLIPWAIGVVLALVLLTRFDAFIFVVAHLIARAIFGLRAFVLRIVSVVGAAADGQHRTAYNSERQQLGIGPP